MRLGTRSFAEMFSQVVPSLEANCVVPSLKAWNGPFADHFLVIDCGVCSPRVALAPGLHFVFIIYEIACRSCQSLTKQSSAWLRL